ncbi:MAG: amidohydrolase family protein [Firmicutes bacterium]|nr:amidohydrolase family protein [Bacillota bacterium]
MKIFDFHTHIFPDELAGGFLERLATGMNITPYSNATLDGTIEVTKKAGIEGFLTLHIATNANQQSKVNDFAIATHKVGKCMAFGSVHPSSSEAVSELKRIHSAGLKGIKMHPDYQQFNLTDKNLYPIYDACSQLGLMILFHAGHQPAFMDVLRGTIPEIKQISKDFPKLTFIGAHFGGLMLADEVAEELAGKAKVYLDTSASVGVVSIETATKIVQRHGAENILFGSDCPWGEPKAHVEFVDRLKITDRERELIYYGNAERLLDKIF